MVSVWVVTVRKGLVLALKWLGYLFSLGWMVRSSQTTTSILSSGLGWILGTNVKHADKIFDISKKL